MAKEKLGGFWEDIEPTISPDLSILIKGRNWPAAGTPLDLVTFSLFVIFKFYKVTMTLIQRMLSRCAGKIRNRVPESLWSHYFNLAL